MRRYEVQRDDGQPFGDGNTAIRYEARTPAQAARLALINDRPTRSIPDGVVLLVRLAESRRSVVNRYRILGDGGDG